MINLKIEAAEFLQKHDEEQGGTWTDDDKDIVIAFATFVENSKYVKEKILQGKIDSLRNLDTALHTKARILKEMSEDFDDPNVKELYLKKLSGVKIAIEEIRRDLKDLHIEINNL